ncbi:DUF2871 domain-containing protein [Paraeggerthella hongkongensis]|uniref:DUF2871 domain-containing protein n=1 Tax=Paraeggerthella hominis TaxID=2897351 RepID=UPI001C106B09|nr:MULTISPECIES: DUF2871 domain-containing protein [Paraeggerthella]MBU5405393.1 DUF2871 domain-containing protein [Paraeggerthella hongkongensis]MCD2432485.1 DUF2871 domain-containing protein [Paraeggerthella hominis]
MVKKYTTFALVYAAIALAMGVFYREFTKILGFDGFTSLSFIHTHYFVLGMVFFLLLALLEKSFSFSAQGKTMPFVVVYNIGLNIACLGFLIRGITQVLGVTLASAPDAALAGIAGIGHILLAVGIVAILLKVRKSAA